MTSAAKRPVTASFSSDAMSALERVQHRAGPVTVKRVGPLRPVAQADGVVISIRKPEPQHQTTCDLGPQCVDQLLSHQPHRGGAEDNDALFVQADEALLRSKIQQLAQMGVFKIHG